MKRSILSIVAVAGLALMSFAPVADKLISSKSHVQFFSSTPAEDISANNYKSVGAIDPASGAVVFSVPMQAFEFENATMQKHFNSVKFLDTKANPKAKLKATITNLGDVSFDKDGTYEVNVKGDLTIKGKTNPIDEKATITVKGGAVSVSTEFNLVLADYGIEFVKGKPSKNIAKDIKINFNAEYAAK
jgi:polyisoprenoid-binding protein YceI